MALAAALACATFVRRRARAAADGAADDPQARRPPRRRPPKSATSFTRGSPASKDADETEGLVGLLFASYGGSAPTPATS